jgi:hypothetical protein
VRSCKVRNVTLEAGTGFLWKEETGRPCEIEDDEARRSRYECVRREREMRVGWR